MSRRPADGWVSNVSLRPGATVQAGTPLFAIIEDGHWWVDANFKETDLARIKLGPEGDHPPRHVSRRRPSTAWSRAISAGSGATFSVLPPENATGNWVKVTQRFPVRIRITSTPACRQAVARRRQRHGHDRHPEATARTANEPRRSAAAAQGRKGKPPAAPPRPVPRRRAAPKRPPIPLVIAVVLTAVLEVLDITIVNVAIPHMLGAFGATSDQITWVLTSYLVSAAVVMPLTGYLSTWLGRRRLLHIRHFRLRALLGLVRLGLEPREHGALPAWRRAFAARRSSP